MKGPSIAVMLGGAKHDEDEDSGELSLSEAKSAAEDAALAFANAVESKDAKKIVASFHPLYELCTHLQDLKESGESDDEEETETEDDESNEE